MMSTQEIAIRPADPAGQGEFEAAQRELFAQDALSIEACATEHFARETQGLPALLEKGRKWQAMVERVHSCSTSAPLVAGNAIATTLAMELTMKGRGRMQLAELCVYAIENGKIVSEQFFR